MGGAFSNSKTPYKPVLGNLLNSNLCYTLLYCFHVSLISINDEEEVSKIPFLVRSIKPEPDRKFWLLLNEITTDLDRREHFRTLV